LANPTLWRAPWASVEEVVYRCVDCIHPGKFHRHVAWGGAM